MESPNPEAWMRRAVELSRKGLPAPNPHVGCVIVRNGEVVGEGYHRYAGELHAEAGALRAAGPLSKGADVFCTLEPCNHQGHQPPCTGALIAAGVRKVWIACQDPNPKVAGGGSAALRQAGIEVESGFLESEAAAVNRPWLCAMNRQSPYVSLKAAMTLDGRIALPGGESQWITGKAARRKARRLRAEMGTVLVGRGTVLMDDPKLTARIRGLPNEPLRIVLDPLRQVPLSARIFQGPGRAVRFVSPEVAREGDLALEAINGQFDLRKLLARLFAEGVTGLLVEGGAATISAFLNAGLADRLDLFVGNAAFGQGPAWCGFEPPAHLAKVVRWKLSHLRKLDDDVWLRYEPMS